MVSPVTSQVLAVLSSVYLPLHHRCVSSFLEMLLQPNIIFMVSALPWNIYPYYHGSGKTSLLNCMFCWSACLFYLPRNSYTVMGIFSCGGSPILLHCEAICHITNLQKYIFPLYRDQDRINNDYVSLLPDRCFFYSLIGAKLWFYLIKMLRELVWLF